MKSRYILIIAFIIIALVQIYVPASMITSRENVIETGNMHKFKTRPIDPNDPFRGKYVHLNFENNSFTAQQEWEYRETAFITFKEDSLGYSIIDKAFKEAPGFTNDFLKVPISSYSSLDTYIKVKFPFDRYYMEESKAPEAERLYIESNKRNELESYAKVYIKDGIAVLNDVMIEDVSLKEWVEKDR